MRALLLVAAVAGVACGPAVSEYELVKAPSGRTLKLEGVSEIGLATGESALILGYRTDLDLTDSAALQAEADEVWRHFRPLVERRGVRMAVIQASQWERPSWERRGRFVRFVAERKPDGRWAVRDPDANTASGGGL